MAEKRTPSPAQPAADGGIDAPESRAAAGEAKTPPGVRMRLPLKTMDDVKAELARLYRDGKAGKRDISDMSKLANVLSILGRLIEGVELAARIDALEQRTTKK